MDKNKIKKYFFILLLSELLFSYAPVYAQTYQTYSGPAAQISTYLCTPNTPTDQQTNVVSNALSGPSTTAAANNNNSAILYSCINKIYKFAIILASSIGVLFIVIAGYIYMSADGNNESVEKAKSILISTITALVILMVGYVFLKAINPDLIGFQAIQPPTVAPPPALIPANPPAGTTTGTQPSGTCSGCVALSSVGVPTQGNASIQVTQNVASMLQQMSSQLSGVTWYVTSGYDYRAATTDCHNTGNCADLGVSPATDANWSRLCAAAQSAGFGTVLNEASQGAGPPAGSCPAFKIYASTNGANIHVQP